MPPKKNLKKNIKKEVRKEIAISKPLKGAANALGLGSIANPLVDMGVSALNFMGLPFGAMSQGGGRPGGRLGGIPAGSLINAPVQTGFVTRQPFWDFNRAPDVGYGAGIRMSGRVILGQIVDTKMTWVSPNQAYIGIQADSDWPPVQMMILSPVAAYNGERDSSYATKMPNGSFGGFDNIIQQIAECFERWKLVDATLVYVPLSGTNVDKQLTIAWVPDATLVAGQADLTRIGLDPGVITSFDTVASIPNSVSFPIWTPATFTLPLDKKNKDLLFVNDPQLDREDPLGGFNVADATLLQARQLFPGGLLFYGQGANSTTDAYTELGTLYCDLTVDLYQICLDQAIPTAVNPPPLSVKVIDEDEKKSEEARVRRWLSMPAYQRLRSKCGNRNKVFGQRARREKARRLLASSTPTVETVVSQGALSAPNAATVPLLRNAKPVNPSDLVLDGRQTKSWF